MRLTKPLPLDPVTAPDTGSLGSSLDQWVTYLQSSDRIGSPRTIDAYLYALNKLVARVGADYRLGDVTSSDIEGLMGDLKGAGMSAAGRSAVYRPIRTFFRWAVKRHLLDTSPAERVEGPVVKVQPVEFVTDTEWKAVLGTCVTRSRFGFRPRRDLAILLMLATTGARLSEVAGLTLGDVDMDAGTILVHGKGGKDRLLPLLPDAKGALTEYLTRERPRSPYSGVSDRLWLTSRGPLTANGIAQLLAERGKAAGLTRRLHAHELRHRFVAGALRDGMPGPLVMALSGHSTPSMLQRYGQWGRVQDAHDMLRELAAKRAAL
jgi:site-specific recombinase XerD